MNICVLIGRVGTEPDMRYTSNGTPVTRLRLAVSAPPRGNSKERQTDWLTVICYGRQAEVVAQYVEKGRLVAVVGRVSSRQFEGRDGQRREAVEIIAQRVEFLGGRGEGARPRPTPEVPVEEEDFPPPEELELPPDEEIFGDL
ncbi:MAG: single-stranded DNA-binding protein [Armatimonadetes bacterium]|nr:single-stranded DNA-binding protein [Armatimonadota bacterium]